MTLALGFDHGKHGPLLDYFIRISNNHCSRRVDGVQMKLIYLSHETIAELE